MTSAARWEEGPGRWRNRGTSRKAQSHEPREAIERAPLSAKTPSSYDTYGVATVIPFHRRGKWGSERPSSSQSRYIAEPGSEPTKADARVCASSH